MKIAITGHRPDKLGGYARNRYMVDRCDIVVAAWDGSRAALATASNMPSKKAKRSLS